MYFTKKLNKIMNIKSQDLNNNLNVLFASSDCHLTLMANIIWRKLCTKKIYVGLSCWLSSTNFVTFSLPASMKILDSVAGFVRPLINVLQHLDKGLFIANCGECRSIGWMKILVWMLWIGTICTEWCIYLSCLLCYKSLLFCYL